MNDFNYKMDIKAHKIPLLDKYLYVERCRKAKEKRSEQVTYDQEAKPSDSNIGLKMLGMPPRRRLRRR